MTKDANNREKAGAGGSIPEAASPAPHVERHAFIRRRLIAGVVMLAPILVTLWILTVLSGWILDTFAPVTQVFWRGLNIERETVKILNVILSWVLAFLVVYLVGLFSSIVFVRRIISLGEMILDRIPVIKSIYGTMKQIAETFSLQRQRSLQRVAVIQYPRRGIYATAFVTGETEFRDDPRTYVNVFVPTTPNPTSGFLLILPAEDVLEADMTVEQAFKFIISGGILEIRNLPLKPYQSLTPEERPPSASEPFEPGREDTP